jgi:hypothetical protein
MGTRNGTAAFGGRGFEGRQDALISKTTPRSSFGQAAFAPGSLKLSAGRRGRESLAGDTRGRPTSDIGPPRLAVPFRSSY